MAIFLLSSGWNADARQKLQRKLQIKPVLIILSLTKAPQNKKLHCSSDNVLEFYTQQLYAFPWCMEAGIGENVDNEKSDIICSWYKAVNGHTKHGSYRKRGTRRKVEHLKLFLFSWIGQLGLHLCVKSLMLSILFLSLSSDYWHTSGSTKILFSLTGKSFRLWNQCKPLQSLPKQLLE